MPEKILQRFNVKFFEVRASRLTVISPARPLSGIREQGLPWSCTMAGVAG